MRRVFSALILCALLGIPVNSHAADIAVLESQVRELMQTVHELKIVVEKQQAEISSLKKTVIQAPAIPVSSKGVPMGSQTPGFGTKILPEIGVIADMAFLADSPKTDGEGADRLSVRELELILGGNVDPYSRFDSTIAFTEEEGVGLEEAYLTRFELPLETTARIGRFKPRIGKDLAVHRDSLDTVDEPLVIQRYFGTEGMSKTGVDVSKLLDMPSPMIHQITIGVLEGGNGEDGTVFGETKRRPTIYGHLKNYVDISDTTNLEVGLSNAIGSRDADAEFEVNVFGIDGTFIHHLNANQNIKFKSEIFNVDRKESQTQTVEDPVIFLDDLDGNVWGGYGLVDLRMNSRWATGFRYDQVEIVDRPVDSQENYDIGYTGYLTFHQSEFARWRLQFTHLDLTDGGDDNQIWIQGTFAIGEHKHKIQ